MSEQVILGKCPICDGSIVEKAKSFACNKAVWVNNGTQEAPSWDNTGCKYSISKNALERQGGDIINSENVKKLLSEGSFNAILRKEIIIDETYGIKVNYQKK